MRTIVCQTSKPRNSLLHPGSYMYCKHPKEKMKMEKASKRTIVCQTPEQRNLLLIRVKEELKMANAILRTIVCQAPK